MKRKIVSFICICVFAFLFVGCQPGTGGWDYSNVLPDTVHVEVLTYDSNFLYNNEYDKEETPFLSQENTYRLRVYVSGAPMQVNSRHITFSYDEEKFEITPLQYIDNYYLLKIFKDFDEATIAVNCEIESVSLTCNLLIKLDNVTNF